MTCQIHEMDYAGTGQVNEDTARDMRHHACACTCTQTNREEKKMVTSNT